MNTWAELPAGGQASVVRPGRVLVTVIGAFFFALGWLAGAAWRVLARAVPYAWRGLVFAGVSMRYGYWRGLGMTDEQIVASAKARSQPAKT